MRIKPQHTFRGGLFAWLPCALLAVGCGNESNSSVDSSSNPKEVIPNPERSSTEHLSKTQVRPDGVLPSFTIVGADSGLDFERFDDMRGQRRLLEVNGGGAALFDFDRDGWLDVFLTNGCAVPEKPDDRASPGALFRNLGAQQFERVSNESRLVQFGYTFGCAVGDYDADGFDDLYVTAFGRNTLWKNNGDGTFDDVTAVAGTAVPAWSSSAAFADVNGDGNLDLYVANYVVDSAESPRLCPHPKSPDGYTSCTPALFEGVDDVLLLGDGEGGFRDVTAAAGLSGLYGKALGVAISDLDGDGRPEIYVANDGEANFLFVPLDETADETVDAASRSDAFWIKFEEQALPGNIALNESGYAQASMGIAVGDYDANGTTDLFLTHFFGDTNTLYVNRGGLLFDDATRSSALGPTSRRTLGFGTIFLDTDNNGWLDLFVANGHVDDRTWMPDDEPYRMRPQLYRNERNGSFVDVSDWGGAYFLKKWVGRGAAAGDLDRDGKIDVVISHQLAPSVALHNETETNNNALVLQLVGTESNRNGYGARVELVDPEVTVVRELIGGGSFQSASAPEIHIGIGAKPGATIRIHWPSGRVETHASTSPGVWVAIEGQDRLLKAPGF
jgi:hypothetical protein